MKVQEAITKMQNRINEPNYSVKSLFIQDIINLVFDELQARRELRFGKRDCLKTSFVALINEMAEWEKKVLLGLGISEEQAKNMSEDFKSLTTEKIMKG